MQVGDLVKKLWHSQNQYHGLIIKTEDRADEFGNKYAVKFTVQHLDGQQKEYWSHELEVISENR